ncbi:MAG: permease [bacterium]
MITHLFIAGLKALEEYITSHILTCLVPAFFLAGAMVTFTNRQAILGYLGESANKWRSFYFAILSSFLIAACSCTVIPVASGLYYAGAGIGVSFIILWMAPATNILALIYTGQILGSSFVLSRIIAAISVALIVGWVMSLTFQKEKCALPARSIQKERFISRRDLVLIILIVVSLLSPNYLVQKGPYTLKVLVWGIATLICAAYALWKIPKELLMRWLRETWWFVKLIFPLVLIGVFIVGIVGKVIPQEWVEKWLGGHSLRASFFATLLGAVSYFATMTEAPFVDTLMKIGMGSGPALTLLLTGPGISLPNWLAVGKVFGLKKALVYVPTIIILGTFLGWFFGVFILK